MPAVRSWGILRFSHFLKTPQLRMISIHIRIIGLNHVGGVLKSSDQALFRSMQQKIHMCHIKGDFQCSSWRVFQYNEKISQKIHHKNLWKNLSWIFFFNNSNHPSIWERSHLIKLWYIHFPAQTSFAYQNKIGRILKFSPVLELQANILVGPLCTTSWRRNQDQENLVLV